MLGRVPPPWIDTERERERKPPSEYRLCHHHTFGGSIHRRLLAMAPKIAHHSPRGMMTKTQAGASPLHIAPPSDLVHTDSGDQRCSEELRVSAVPVAAVMGGG